MKPRVVEGDTLKWDSSRAFGGHCKLMLATQILVSVAATISVLGSNR